jgi:hypothetical protein
MKRAPEGSRERERKKLGHLGLEAAHSWRFFMFV